VRPARRFAFGREPVPPWAAQQPEQNEDVITAPLPDCVAPTASPSQGRPTLPLAERATPPAPALPFRALVASLPPEVAPPVAPYRRPRVAPRWPAGVYVTVGAVSLALYSVVLVAVMAPRHAVDAPVVAGSAAPTSAQPAVPAPVCGASASTAAPSATGSAPAALTSASAPAALASASQPVRPPSTPRPVPARAQRPPAPAPTAHPATDVRNPWSYD
jgi:hypothetical protein